MKYRNTKQAENLFRGIGEIDEKWVTLAMESTGENAAVFDGIQKPKREHRHFILYELKKLLGVRYLWVFLVLLLLLNSAAAWYTADNTTAAEEPTAMIAEFFSGYFTDTEEYEAHYAEILAFNEEQNRLFTEAMHAGNVDFETETMPDVYSTDERYSDARLFAKLYEALNAAKNYPDVIQKVIDQANANLAEFTAMGISEDSFTWKYQMRVIALYELARDNVRIDVEYTRGWDEYFDYDLVNVFLAVMILMLGTLVFAQEKQNGVLPILRTAKHGRMRTACAKIAVMLLLSCAFVLLFTFSTFAVYGIRIGYSSPDNALQALETFTLSPYRITVGQYFGVTVLIRLLAYALFSGVMMAISTLFNSYILVYLAGLGFYGLNYLFSTLDHINASNPLRNLNLVSVSAVNPLFVRYRAVDLAGNVAGYVPVMLVTFSVLLVLSCTTAAGLYTRGYAGLRPVWLDRMLSDVMTFTAGKCTAVRTWIRKYSDRTHTAQHGQPGHSVRLRRARSYSMNLIAAETFKTLISSRFIFLLAVLLCVKIGYSADVYAPVRSYADAVYKEYMTTLSGPLTEDKLEYLREERAAIDETLSRQTEMRQAFLAEQITFDDYHAYLSDYNYAYSRSELLTVIEEHADYLARQKAETGIDGWFVYDTGWKTLFSGDADLFLYTAILLLLTGTFVSEYASRSSSGGFAQILRSTKGGREKTFTAKLLSAVMLAAVLAIVLCGADIALVFRNFEMPEIGAPLLSVQMFGTVTTDITLGGYLVLFVLLRLTGAVLMALLVCALSELLARYIPVLGSAVVLTLLPALCAAFGLGAAEKINFLNLLAGTPLVLQSMSMTAPGAALSGWAMLALWITVAGCAVGIMTVSARCAFIR
ncbi:MAG: ABC transporter permease [Clostridia bacterium]|nr:ABC transporter permease [Clostridia bacterium]